MSEQLLRIKDISNLSTFNNLGLKETNQIKKKQYKISETRNLKKNGYHNADEIKISKQKGKRTNST